jgi:hypothetical protein
MPTKSPLKLRVKKKLPPPNVLGPVNPVYPSRPPGVPVSINPVSPDSEQFSPVATRQGGAS